MNSSAEMTSETYTQPVGGLHGEHVIVPADNMDLLGWYACPEGATGAVLIPSLSSELGTPARGVFLAHTLESWGIATLIVDPLSAHESALLKAGQAQAADPSRLARRLCGAIDWMITRPELRRLQIGIFGHAEAEEPVLNAAATCPDRISSVLLVGYPAHLGPQGFGDGLKRGYVIDAPTDEQSQESLARFAAAWFSQTLRPAPRD